MESMTAPGCCGLTSLLPSKLIRVPLNSNFKRNTVESLRRLVYSKQKSLRSFKIVHVSFPFFWRAGLKTEQVIIK